MSVSPEKYSQARPVTLTDAKPSTNPLDQPIPYKFTPGERDELAIARVELERHKRAMSLHRDPAGLVTGTATTEDWDAAVASHRGRV